MSFGQFLLVTRNAYHYIPDHRPKLIVPSQNVAKRQICIQNLKFNRRLGSIAAEARAKFQNDVVKQITNLVAIRRIIE